MADTIRQTGTTSNIPGAASELSLSQAILAPLDALFKAQVHSARSFLNLLLQIGYPHVQLDPNGNPDKDQLKSQSFYTQDFVYTDDEGHNTTISMPSLALIPITPLSIDNASFKFNFNVQSSTSHSQIQSSESNSTEKEESYARDKRPWYLVDEPQSFKGTVAPNAQENSSSSQSQSSVINIEISLSKQPLPSGLDKLLTMLQQSTRVIDRGKE
ncbi:MAG: DUF2589 domain-containing protein [Chlorobium sp.]